MPESWAPMEDLHGVGARANRDNVEGTGILRRGLACEHGERNPERYHPSLHAASNSEVEV